MCEIRVESGDSVADFGRIDAPVRPSSVLRFPGSAGGVGKGLSIRHTSAKSASQFKVFRYLRSSLACHRDQMPEFLRDFGRLIHGGRDLAADQFAETRAQAVDGNFHGGFGNAERESGIGL